MTKNTTFAMATLATAFLATSALAQDAGDPAEGEKVFRQCKTCHAVTDADGNDVVKGGKVGPNLYGVVGRTAGTWDDFRYSDSMIAAGEAGLEWNAEDFTVYVQDPTAFLRDYLDDKSARGKMTFKLRDPADAAHLWAYLNSVGPDGGGS